MSQDKIPRQLELARVLELVLHKYVRHIDLEQISYNHKLDLAYVNLVYDNAPLTLTIKPQWRRT